MASHYGYIKINWPKVSRRIEAVEHEILEHDASYLKNSVCFLNYMTSILVTRIDAYEYTVLIGN